MNWESRFWAKVYKSSDCWLWLGAQTVGYGVIRTPEIGAGPKQVSRLAHRIVWELKHGPIPEGMVACHKCDVRNCVNTDHLFLGTKRDNAKDGASKGRMGNLGAEPAFPSLTEDEWIEYANQLIAYRTPVSPVSRFWAKVDKSSDCWLWTSTLSACGYGQFHAMSKKTKKTMVSAHRHAWELTHGPIPDGLCVCHRCDVRNCVNPAHLFLGTAQDNMQDMWNKGRHLYLIGANNGRAKLDEQTVQTIRSLYAGGGITYRELALMHNVSKRTIGQVIKRETWRHLP